MLQGMLNYTLARSIFSVYTVMTEWCYSEISNVVNNDYCLFLRINWSWSLSCFYLKNKTSSFSMYPSLIQVKGLNTLSNIQATQLFCQIHLQLEFFLTWFIPRIHCLYARQISPGIKTFSSMLQILFPIIHVFLFVLVLFHYCVGKLSQIIIQVRVHRM